MRILLVNTYDYGGAANACINLHLGLLKNGIDSTLLVLEKTRFDIPKIISFRNQAKNETSLLKKISNSIRYRLEDEKYYEINNDVLKQVRSQRDKRLDLFSSPISQYDITKAKAYWEADIVNFHWVAGFLDYPSFFRKNNKPLFWTLHDMFPFTAGEHYYERFLGIDQDGYPIHRNVDSDSKRFEENQLKLVEKSLAGSSIHIISPSQWLLNQSNTSSLFKKMEHSLIPNGFDTSIFNPSNKTNHPKKNSHKTILFVADHLHHERKGLEYLIRAIKMIDRSDIKFIAVGEGEILNSRIKHLGRVDDKNKMAELYQKADLFVIPSLEDNLPNTMIESLLCGTPVIGFPVGGIKETIKNGINGFLAEDISVKSLAKVLELGINNLNNFNSNNISKDARIIYNYEKQAAQYLKLFQYQL